MTRLRALQYPALVIGIAVAFFSFSKPTHAAASVVSVSPTDVLPGTTVLTITGAGFGTLGRVCFDIITSNTIYTDSSCASSSGAGTTWTDTSITVTVPADAASGAVTIHYYPPGIYYPTTALAAGTIFVKPTITSSTQYHASLAIYGTNFGSTAGNVLIDNLPAAIQHWQSNYVLVGIPSLPFDTYVPSRSVPITLQALNTVTGQLSILSDALPTTINRIFTNDTYSDRQYYLPLLGLPGSWSVPLKKQQVVAVIDSGVYINHPDLHNSIWTNTNEVLGNHKDDDRDGYVDDVYGWNFIDGNADTTPKNSHGTMVAGIIAAARDNGEGIAGINPSAKIMPLTVCDSSGCAIRDVTEAIHFAVDHGATIINLSLGSTGSMGFKTDYDEAINYAYVHNVIVVAAAGNGDVEGNNGINLRQIPQSPVCNDSGNAVIGVAAQTADGKYRTNWTNYDDPGGGCVDIFAPGENIVSTSVPALKGEASFTPIDDQGAYSQADGTSFAAPIVAGLLSLEMQQYPTMPYQLLVNRLYSHEISGRAFDAFSFLTESYTPPPIPTIPKISRIRNSVEPGTTDSRVLRRIVIYGENFTPKTKVKVDKLAIRKVVFRASKVLIVFVPLSKLRVGKHSFTVINPDGQTSTSKGIFKITR